MSEQQKYITRGIQSEIPPWIQNFLWHSIDTMDVSSKDYLQVFSLCKVSQPESKSQIDSNSQSVLNLQDYPGTVINHEDLQGYTDTGANQEDIQNNCTQKIVHSQEQPLYKKEYSFKCPTPAIDAKIFVIDDNTQSTMLLAEEY